MKVNKWLVAGIVGLTGLGLLTGCGDKKETASTPSSSEVQQKTPTAEEPFIEGVPMDYYVGEEGKELKKPDLYFVPTKDHKVEIYDVNYNNDGEKEGLQDYKHNDPKFVYTVTLPYKVEKTNEKDVYKIVMTLDKEESSKIPYLLEDSVNDKNQIVIDVTEDKGQLYLGTHYKGKTWTKKELISDDGTEYLLPSSYTDK